MLLPIWRRLPQDGCRVYRLQTDDGERVIGRRVSLDWIAQALGESAPAIVLGDPSFTAPIYANLFDDEGGETYSLIWSRANGKRQGD